MYGCIPSPPDKRDFRISYVMDFPATSTEESVPRSFTVPFVPNMKNQESTSSCTAFALSYIFECINKKIVGEYDTFSTGYLYGNRRESNYEGIGQEMRSAVKTAQKHGDVKSDLWDNNLEVPQAVKIFEEEYPKIKYLSHKLIKNYVRIHDRDEAKAFLYRYKIPLFVSTRSSNINPLIKSDGYHALACVGYTWDNFFKCHNSWGEKNCPKPELKYDEFDEVWGIIPMEEIKFTDVENGRWSADSIKNAATDGIIAGYPDGTFKPSQSLTREEIAVVWERMKRYCEEHYAKKL